MGSLSLVHWLIVVLVILVLFSPGRIARAGKELANSIKVWRKELGPSDHDPKSSSDQPSDQKS
jgi:sec-independent protein translocase protein TatA